MAGDQGPTGPCWPMPCGIGRCHPCPCHITDLWDGLHTASPPLIQVGLIERMMLSCLGSMGPLSYTWRGQTDLQTTILTMATDLPTMEPPPRANHHCWMARRRDGRSADAPWHRRMAKSPQTTSSSPTSTPMPSTHYKRVSGTRWRSSLSSSQAFQVFQALRSSPE